MSRTLAQIDRYSRVFFARLIHLVVIVSMLLPGLAYTPARAASFNQADDGTPTPSVTPEASETPEAGGTPAPISTAEGITTTQEIPTPTATVTLTPTVEIPTATPTVTPTLPAPAPTITATIVPTTVETAPGGEIIVADPMSLTLSADASRITPGGVLNLYWQIDGWADGYSGVNLTIHPPSNLSALDGTDGIIDPQTGVLSLPVLSATDDFRWQIPDDIPGPYTVTASLSQAGKIVATRTITLQETGLTRLPVEGGTASGLHDQVKVTIPEKAAGTALDVRVRRPVESAMPPTTPGGEPFEILARDPQSQQEVHHFDQPITIEVAYDGDRAAFLMYYDPEQQNWFPLPTEWDETAGMLRAQSDHLSVFDTSVQDWETARTPSVKDFQVSGQTGAASYSFPIWTPPGPAGLQPSLSLSYNSQTVEGSKAAYTQASWVGMGWSLETGFIRRNQHRYDDTFSLLAGGVSSDILQDNSNHYHMADENYWKIDYDATNDKWTVYDKNGTIYRFGKNADNSYDARARYQICNSNGTVTTKTWNWPLVEVENIYGQKLTYTYDLTENRYVSIGACSGTHRVHFAVYPQYITYPNGKYRVKFNLESRNDYRNEWESSTNQTYYMKRRLNTVNIEQYTGSAWQTVRSYDLSYNAVIFPGYTWDPGGQTFSISGIQETGLGGATLPATTFSYSDNLHLTTANNGYGGSVVFAYESTPWSEVDHNDDYVFEENFNPTTMDCEDWHGGASCKSINYNLEVNGTAYHDSSMQALQPGTAYLVEFSAKKDTSSTITVKAGLEYNGTTAEYTQEVTLSDWNYHGLSEVLVIPANSNHIRMLLVCSDCIVDFFKITLLTTRYRVTGRTIADSVTTSSQTFNYEYDDTATNDAEHSDAVAGEDPEEEYDLMSKPYGEYRGAAMSREIGPAGTDGSSRVTTTWYAQDDDWKGQSVASMVGTRDFYQQFESTSWSTYDPDWDYNGAAPVFERVSGDVAARVENAAADWTKGLYRPTTSLSNGEGVTVQFRLGSAGMQSVLAIASGTYGQSDYYRWGLRYASGNIYFHTCTTSESTCNDGSSPPVVLSGVSTNTWYMAQIFVDDDQLFLAQVWERGNPEHIGRYQQDVGLDGRNWKFIQKSKSGTTWLDEYSEGKVYSLSTTGYQTTSTYPLTIYFKDYLDLAINWTRPVTSTSMNFNGDGAWIGTRTISKYEAADQGGTQYGNQTHVIESKWSGSAWQDYRATRTWYYPYTPTGKYLVGLPGVTKRYKCNSVACDYGTDDLLGMQWYLYDGQTKYWVAPGTPTGKLTAQRTFVCFANDSNVCYEGYNASYTRQMYSDTQFEYDDWGNTIKTKVYSGYGYYAIATGDSVLATTVLSETSACYGNTGKPTGCTDDGYYTYKLWEKDPLGQQTDWSYSGALWNGSSYTGYTLGVPVSEQSPNGVNTKVTAEYDNFGRMIKVIKPGDSSASPTVSLSYYDTASPFYTQAVQRIDASTNLTVRKLYDGLGRLIQTQTGGAVLYDGACSDGAHNPDWCDIIVDKEYDAYGSLYRQTVPLALSKWGGSGSPYRGRNFVSSPRNYTSTIYDALGRATTATAPDGTSTVTSYPATSNGFADYSETRVKDARNNTTRSLSDVWGHTLQVIPLNGDSDTSPINPSVTYTYSELDQLKTAVRGGATVTLSYDYAGRKTQQIDPDLGTWYYWYDALGQMVGQQDAKTQMLNLTYDALGRVTSKATLDSTTTSFYDPFDSKNLSEWVWSSYQTVPYNDGGNNVVKTAGSEPNWNSNFHRSSYNLSHGEGLSLRFKVDANNTIAHFMIDTVDGGVYRRFGVFADGGALSVQYMTDGANYVYPGSLLPNLEINAWYVLQMVVDDVGGFTLQAYKESA